MDSTKIVDKIQELKWVTSTADAFKSGLKYVISAAGPVAQPVKNVLNGTIIGHPLHPAVTDIPIGAWSVAAALDIAESCGAESVADGADAAVAIGLLGALGSVVTGLADWNDVDDEKPKQVGALHAILNISATVLYAISLILRRRNHRRSGRFTAGAGYCLVGASAYLGGLLVFDLKTGVDHADRENLPDDWVPVVPESELKEGVPACATVGELQVVLVKLGEGVKVLANLCSHAGGPLCEGSVKDGTIVCPWHGSRFDLTTGAVVDGPATAVQPAFQTRIVDGKVEIKSLYITL